MIKKIALSAAVLKMGVLFVSGEAQFPIDTRRTALMVELGTGGRGSGFFLERRRTVTREYASNSVFLVTAKHVLFSTKQNGLQLWSSNCILTFGNHSADPIVHHASIDLGAALALSELRVHPTRDIALVHWLDYTTDRTNRISHFPKKFVITSQTDLDGFRTVPESEAIPLTNVIVGSLSFTFGYPSSVGSRDTPQLDQARPLLRRGSVADVDQNRHIVVLDLPIYKGNSGALVFAEHRINMAPATVEPVYRPIGVITQFVPFEEKWWNDQYVFANTTIANSGYSICEPMDSVTEIVW